MVAFASIACTPEELAVVRKKPSPTPADIANSILNSLAMVDIPDSTIRRQETCPAVNISPTFGHNRTSSNLRG